VTLNVNNVRDGNLRLVQTWNVVGQVVAQPLYANGLVIVATEANRVYAFDATQLGTKKPKWETPELSPPVLREDLNGFVNASITCPIKTNKQEGITATPVIDISTNRLFVEMKTEVTPHNYQHWMVSLDLTTGREIRRTQINARVKTRTDASIDFYPAEELSRPGLLLLKGVVYAAFGSINCDTPRHLGWVLGYDAKTLKQVAAFCTLPTPKTQQCNTSLNGAGIWQAGNGLASDGDSIYVMTGNGDFDSSAHPFNVGDSFVKLTPTAAGVATVDGVGVRVSSVFAPDSQAAMLMHDLDLGSAGPVLLMQPGLLVGGGKEGKLYVLDKDTMQADRNNPPFQATHVFGKPDCKTDSDCPTDVGCPAKGSAKCVSGTCTATAVGCCELNWLPHIHGSPVYWKPSETPDTLGFLYVMGEKDALRAFQFDPKAKKFDTNALVSKVRSPGFPDCKECMPGGVLSLSSNGAAQDTGIVWASVPTGGNAEETNQHGILHAVNAITLEELWNNSKDPPYYFAKFTPPTIADGLVFLAGIGGNDRPNVGDNNNPTDGLVMVYGLGAIPNPQ
jgi:outer membrane protein assembly factor BamB